MEQQTPDQEMESLFQVPSIRGPQFPGPGVSKRLNLAWLAQLFNGNPYNGGDVAILNSVMQLLKQPDWGSFWLLRISDYLRQQNILIGTAPEKDLYYYIERRWMTYAANGPDKVLREAATQVDELARVFYLPLTYMRTLVDCVPDPRIAQQPFVQPGFPTGGPTPQPLGGWQQYTGSLPGGIVACSDDRLMSGRIHAAGFATDAQRDRPRVDLTGGRFIGSEHPDPAETLANLDPYKMEWRHFPEPDVGTDLRGDLTAVTGLEEAPVNTLAEAAAPGVVDDSTGLPLLHVTFGVEPFVAPCTEVADIETTFWITDTDLFALMLEVSVWCDGGYRPLVNVVRDAIELGGYTQQVLLAKIVSGQSGVSYKGNNVVVNEVPSVLAETTLSGLVEAAVVQYIRQMYEDRKTTLVLAVGVTIDNQDDRKVTIAQRWLELLSAIKATMGALTQSLEWSEVTVKRELAGYQRAAYGLAPKPLDIDMPVLFQVPQRINARYTSFPILVEDFRTLLEAIKVQSCPEYKNAEWYTVSMLEYLQWCAKTMVGSEYSDSLDLIKRIANLLSNKKATRLENGDTFELSGVGAFTYSPQLLSDMIWGWLLHCGAELVCNRGTEVPTSVFDATKVDITLGGASVRATVLWRLFSGHMASMNREGGKPNVYANSTGSTITLKNGDQRAFADLPAVKWLLG